MFQRLGTLVAAVLLIGSPAEALNVSVATYDVTVGGVQTAPQGCGHIQLFNTQDNSQLKYAVLRRGRGPNCVLSVKSIVRLTAGNLRADLGVAPASPLIAHAPGSGMAAPATTEPDRVLVALPKAPLTIVSVTASMPPPVEEILLMPSP